MWWKRKEGRQYIHEDTLGWWRMHKRVSRQGSKAPRVTVSVYPISTV